MWKNLKFYFHNSAQTSSSFLSRCHCVISYWSLTGISSLPPPAVPSRGVGATVRVRMHGACGGLECKLGREQHAFSGLYCPVFQLNVCHPYQTGFFFCFFLSSAFYSAGVCVKTWRSLFLFQHHIAAVVRLFFSPPFFFPSPWSGSTLGGTKRLKWMD